MFIIKTDINNTMRMVIELILIKHITLDYARKMIFNMNRKEHIFKGLGMMKNIHTYTV
jgi:hypothetical protein